MKSLKKAYILSLKKIEIGSAIAVRLTKYTGQSKEFVHPKHFLNPKPWFTKYLNKKDTVLDLGSGNGQNAIKCAKIAKKVVGIEIDKKLLGIAQNVTREKKLKNLHFESRDLEKKLDIKNSTFDKVIFLDVLEHIYKRDQLLEEIRRILKPKGLMLIGVPNKDTLWKKTQRSVGISSFADPDHKIEFSEDGIRKLLNKHKYKILNFEYAPYDTPFRGLFDIIGVFSLPIYKKIYKIRQDKVKKNKQDASGFEIAAQRI